MENEAAIVVFSGGQDSTTCLAIALSMFKHVETLCFNYGQRHAIELTQAKIVADIAGVSYTEIPLDLLSQFTTNALTHPEIDITHENGELPSTFVPGRNHLFLSVAAIYAYQKNIRTLFTGVCQTDEAGYPDCRAPFIQALTQSLNLAMATTFEIQTPLMTLTKAETIQTMATLGKLEWYKHTHTCYEGKRPACGRCPACKLRLKGFAEAGITDPLDYT